MAKQLQDKCRSVFNCRGGGDNGVSHSQLASAERKVEKYKEQADRLMGASGSARDAVGMTQEAFAPRQR